MQVWRPEAGGIARQTGTERLNGEATRVAARERSWSDPTTDATDEHRAVAPLGAASRPLLTTLSLVLAGPASAPP